VEFFASTILSKADGPADESDWYLYKTGNFRLSESILLDFLF
jgi:hypothetical protein